MKEGGTEAGAAAAMCGASCVIAIIGGARLDLRILVF